MSRSGLELQKERITNSTFRSLSRSLTSDISRANGHRSIKIWPGMSSFDQEMINFSTMLSSIDQKPVISKEGFLEAPYFASDHGMFNQIAGTTMNPEGITPDPEKRKFDPSLIKLAKSLSWLFNSRADACSISLVEGRSSGFPLRTKDSHLRVKFFRQAISRFQDTCRDCGSMTNLDFAEHFNKIHGVYPFFWSGRRTQPDNGHRDNGDWEPKQREVYSHKGKMIVERDVSAFLKSLGLDFTGRKFSLRKRLVWQANAEGNAPLLYVGKVWRGGVINKFPYTLKHNMQNLRLTKNFPVSKMFSIDFANFDWTLGSDIVFPILDHAPFPKDVVDYVKKIMTMPALMKYDFIGETGAFLSGLDNDLFFEKFGEYLPYGSPSGHGLVSEVAKFVGLTLAIWILTESGIVANDERAIRQLLEGDNKDVVLKSGGDDNLFAFRTTEDADKALAFINKSKSGFKITQDVPTKFLGHFFRMEGADLKTFPDPANIMKKKMLAEASFGARSDYPEFGFHIAKEFYSSLVPNFRYIYGQYSELFYRATGQTIDDVMWVRNSPLDDNRVLRNAADVEYIVNPDSIHYKIDEDDLSSETREKFFITFSESEFAELELFLRNG